MYEKEIGKALSELVNAVLQEVREEKEEAMLTGLTLTVKTDGKVEGRWNIAVEVDTEDGPATMYLYGSAQGKEV